MGVNQLRLKHFSLCQSRHMILIQIFYTYFKLIHQHYINNCFNMSTEIHNVEN